MAFVKRPLEIVPPDQALKGRDTPILTARTHFVDNHPLKGPYPEGMKQAQFAMGSFWAAERRFWPLTGVWVTASGYAGGSTPNPTYDEVMSGQTGHAQTVLVVFDPARIGYRQLLAVFWEGHDPTQGMRQGNDIGTPFRSGIYTTDEAQAQAAEDSRDAYGQALSARGFGPITTEIKPAGPFYFAEASHQQYLARNPHGYVGAGGTGVSYPVATATG
jgi:peptide-methionine (S)-S-oxide reductase